MDLDLLKALNDFAAAHDAFEDPVTFYNKVSILLFAGLLAVLFLVGRRQGARAAVAAGIWVAVLGTWRRALRLG